MNNEDIFYLFTQAMDLKYEDTVEAINDLVKFCITTENTDIWNDIYRFVREKAQFIIDNDNEYDKNDCIEEFKGDDWLQQYIQKIKGNKKMTFNNVINVVREYEEEVLFDVEAPDHWYSITYENNKLKLSEVDEYHQNGDEWGEIITKTNVYKIEEYKCTLEEYLKFVIRFFNAKMLYRQHEYPSENYVVEKIDVVMQNDY